jgi:hypothetical protein
LQEGDIERFEKSQADLTGQVARAGDDIFEIAAIDVREFALVIQERFDEIGLRANEVS